MDCKTSGTVISASKQWWLKVNTKPIRSHSLDGAVFPHIIRVSYNVNGVEYIKKKWIGAGKPVPAIGSSLTVAYSEDTPSRAKIL